MDRASPWDLVESTDTVPLFPTFVYRTQLKEAAFQRINAGIRRKLAELTSAAPPLARGSKWQTEQRLHELPEFAELMSVVEGASHGVLDWLRVMHSGIRITGCWANVSAPGAEHKLHNHPNNYLSGVYYVQADEGARHITFEDPRPQSNILTPQVSETLEHNAGAIHLGVREGLLVLVPSWLEHCVPSNDSARDRISIAVNVMFEQFAERMARPKWEGNVPVASTGTREA